MVHCVGLVQGVSRGLLLRPGSVVGVSPASLLRASSVHGASLGLELRLTYPLLGCVLTLGVEDGWELNVGVIFGPALN